MADNVIFQTEDALSESNLELAFNRSNNTNYVESGFGITLDAAAGEIDVAAGVAHLSGLSVDADARTAVSLPVASGLNHVYLVVDTAANNAVSIEAESSETSHSTPALKLGEIDTSSDTVTELSRAPTGSFDAVYTEQLSHGRTVAISSTAELESAFNNLQAGDQLYLYQPDTPYRPSQWLDIDVSNVEIVAESWFADDGNPMITVTDGANVGGIRVGWNAAVSNVTIRGVGYDGNHATQDQTVKELDGILIDKATDVVVHGCFVTGTSPYHEHNTGGSGITATVGSESVRLLNNTVEDPGDRCIQIASTNCVVAYNRLRDGFDRGISTQVPGRGYSGQNAQNCLIVGNRISDLVEGSAIGIHGFGAADSAAANNTMVVGNVVDGEHRNLVRMHDNPEFVVISNNVGDASSQTSETVSKHGIHLQATGSIARSLIISNNILNGYRDSGVRIESTVEDYVISGNTIRNVGLDGVRVGGGEGVISANNIRGSGESGIEVRGGFATVDSNVILSNGDRGVYVMGGAAVVSSNYISDNANHGVFVGNNATSLTTVEGNALEKNGTTNGNEDIIALVTATIRDNNILAESGTPALYADDADASVVGNRIHQGSVSLGAVGYVGENTPAITLATPPKAETGNSYLDDGTNTGTGTMGKRVHDGTTWVDAWTV